MAAAMSQQSTTQPPTAAPHSEAAPDARNKLPIAKYSGEFAGQLQTAFPRPRTPCFSNDRYVGQRWCNPFCRQDYRKFLKFVGRSYRNYLSDGPPLARAILRCDARARDGSQGGACRVSPTSDFAPAIGRSRPFGGGKRLPACPHPDLARVALRLPAGGPVCAVCSEDAGSD
jgi:hypothetical protein